MKRDEFGVPVDHGWKTCGDFKPAEKRNPFILLTWQQLKDVIPFIFRFFCYWIKRLRCREKFFIDSFRPLTLFPYYGVPCGGMGCGSIGRDFRGAFCKFSLRPGMVEHNVTNVPENQFIVTIRRDKTTVYQKVLSAAPPCPKNKMTAWDFGFPAANLQYTGLYPRSWTVYSIPEQGVTLCCRQMSPVLPHNYKDSCLPVTLFSWSVRNFGDSPVEVSITTTFRNGTGDERWAREGRCSTNTFGAKYSNKPSGIDLQHTISGMQCTYCLAADVDQVEVTTTTFDVKSNGQDVWNTLWDFGHFPENFDSSQETADSMCKEIGIALCCKATVRPSVVSSFTQCLTWYMPEVWFTGMKRTYQRRYSKWFECGADLCRYALANCQRWESEIDRWQEPILDDSRLPGWYREALFNELYYLTDGGSVWINFEDSWRMSESHLTDYTCNIMQEYGRFAYLESFEYRMFNTYDVHFYSSFAFACLFPKIQHCIQAEYSDQITNEDTTRTHFFFNGEHGIVKQKFRVPHDLGCPAFDPWLHTNAYVMHNTANWKDLNLKFVLTSMRDFFIIPDGKERLRFLEHVWPNVKILLEVGLNEWDKDGDGMIENGGTCDQTYDTWRMKGTSAYCGSLWLGALKCAAKMANLLGHEKQEKFYADLLTKATKAFTKKLWTGEYYKFDEFSLDNDAVMADQLCGYWFLCACGLQDEILPQEDVRRCLQKVYSLNVGQFGAGRLGAVNGRKADGTGDRVSMQGDEMWTGVSYGLASFMIDRNLEHEGFKTAEGVYTSVFGRLGMQYQTPEAIYEHTNYRAVGYMRAMAIWAIQWMTHKQLYLNID